MPVQSPPPATKFLNHFHTIPFSFPALNGLFVRVLVREGKALGGPAPASRGAADGSSGDSGLSD